MKHKNKLIISICINLIIFAVVNIIFNIKYEQVDDFIIYNLYSGLDGTYNIHGVYIHWLLCFAIGWLFRLAYMINWHSIFLLSVQFICFTSIGYTILRKQDNETGLILYVVCNSIFYTSLLLMIQYTSVAALAILTAFILLIDMVEGKEKKSLKYKLFIFILFAIGLMIRLQALLIILPFMSVYFFIYLLKFLKNKENILELKELIKNYLFLGIVLLIVYTSNLVFYNTNNVYKEYMEYNNIRATLHDIIHVDYEENKEIFDEIGWSKNDYYMFYTFNIGDENIYSKQNIEKVLEYKIKKDGKYNINLKSLVNDLIEEQFDSLQSICAIFYLMFGMCLWNKSKVKINCMIFLMTIGMHALFIAIGRSLYRVIIPGYIIGTFLLLYNLKFKNKKSINYKVNKQIIIMISSLVLSIIIVISFITGKEYSFNYKTENYQSMRNIIEYTNSNKQNVYLYTVPSLQYRYLAYNVYQMPPKYSFSNLRVIGGWDMYTQNYIDFKNRYNLQGTLLDLLNENVYLIDGEVYWSGRKYDNYKQHILYAIKEHYNIDVECKEIKQFGNLKIYKLIKNEAN